MKAYFSVRTLAVGIGIGALLTASITAGARGDLSRTPPSGGTGRLDLGDTIPTVALRRLSGDSVLLKDYMGKKPALVVLAKLADCLSCAGYRVEFDIVRREFPTLAPVLIGTGDSFDSFQAAAESHGFDSSLMVDEGGLLEPQGAFYARGFSATTGYAMAALEPDVAQGRLERRNGVAELVDPCLAAR